MDAAQAKLLFLLVDTRNKKEIENSLFFSLSFLSRRDVVIVREGREAIIFG